MRCNYCKFLSIFTIHLRKESLFIIKPIPIPIRMSTIQNYPNQLKKKNNTAIILIALILVAINIGAYYFNAQIDLTSDQRYTTTPATKNLLKEIKDPIEVSVYLTGENVPAAFQRLAKSTTDVLTNFRNLSDQKVSFQTLDPLGSDTSIFEQIEQYRMQGIAVTVDAGKQGKQQKMIFPWVLVKNTKTGAAMPVFIQETNAPQLSRSVLNKSEMLLEYNIANAINQVTKSDVAKIAFLTGNGEVLGYNILSALGALGSYYQLDTLNLQQQITIPNNYNALIVCGPQTAFTALDKFKLDQYIMHGGQVMFLIDGASGTLDSFKQTGNYNPMPVDVALSDLLFQYGVRVNNNLIADGAASESIPLSKTGNIQESMLYPWVYFPVLKANEQHSITKNLEGVLGRFVSTIDLIDNDVNKTVLLQTSKYSKVESVPTPLALTNAILEENTTTYKDGEQNIAVLLEGNFNSLYKDNRPEEVAQHIATYQLQPKAQSENVGKIIVVSDADIIANDLTKNGPLDLGEYIYGSFKYDNKSFLLNSMEYLTNPNNLLEARNKSFSNRILDPKVVERERGFWQLINIAIPALSIILLGVVWFFLRKKKYG